MDYERRLAIRRRYAGISVAIDVDARIEPFSSEIFEHLHGTQ